MLENSLIQRSADLHFAQRVPEVMAAGPAMGRPLSMALLRVLVKVHAGLGIGGDENL